MARETTSLEWRLDRGYVHKGPDDLETPNGLCHLMTECC
jgi:hypothetical protein